MWLIRWALLAALWLGLTDTHTFPELVTGAVVAALGATLAGLVARPGPPRTLTKALAVLTVGPRRLLHPLVRLVADTGLLSAALWRQLARRQPVRGSFRATRRPPDSALKSSAGRVIVESWGSLSCNRYVVGIDEDDVLLVHELVRSDAPLDPLGRS